MALALPQKEAIPFVEKFMDKVYRGKAFIFQLVAQEYPYWKGVHRIIIDWGEESEVDEQVSFWNSIMEPSYEHKKDPGRAKLENFAKRMGVPVDDYLLPISNQSIDKETDKDLADFLERIRMGKIKINLKKILDLFCSGGIKNIRVFNEAEFRAIIFKEQTTKDIPSKSHFLGLRYEVIEDGKETS